MTEIEVLKAQVKKLAEENEMLKSRSSGLSMSVMKTEILAKIDYKGRGKWTNSICVDEMRAIHKFIMDVKP